MDTLAECETFKKMEELTGVKVNWVYPPVGSETDNFNLPVITKDRKYLGFLSRAKVLDVYKDVIAEESDD